MDNLSRLGFLCAELLLDGFRDIIKQDPYSSAIVLANANGSLDTDLKYHRTRLSLGPSPAIFVYTLPNIVMGEICIRHGIKGENIFFLDQAYDIASQVEYVNLLLDDSIATHCIAGWVDLLGNSYDGFLYLTKKGEATGFSPLEPRTIEQYYNN